MQIQQSDETKATFPVWRTNYIGSLNKGLGAERQLASRIASPADRWSGTNKYGRSNAEHDRLYDAWASTLDRSERNRVMVEHVKVTMGKLPYRKPQQSRKHLFAPQDQLVGDRPNMYHSSRDV